MNSKKVVGLVLVFVVALILLRLFPLVIRFVEAAAFSMGYFGRVVLGLLLIGLVAWLFIRNKRNDRPRIIDQ